MVFKQNGIIQHPVSEIACWEQQQQRLLLWREMKIIILLHYQFISPHSQYFVIVVDDIILYKVSAINEMVIRKFAALADRTNGNNTLF